MRINSEIYKTRMSSNGRIVIPAVLREMLGFKDNEELIITIADGEIRIFNRKVAIRKAQEMAKKYAKGSKSATEILFDMRKEEIKRG